MNERQPAVWQGKAAPAPVPQQRPATVGIFQNPATFDASARMAQCLAESTVIPREYQRNPGNCLIALEMAGRINTSPMMVMQNLYIVNGRPAWSSQWIIAMINASKRYRTELLFEFGDDKEDGGLSCMAWAEDWNGHRVCGPKVTMKMAEAEGWVAKNGSKWKTMPMVMIQYRAASFFGRMNCPDMIMGIYSQEEAYEIETPMPANFTKTELPKMPQEAKKIDDGMITTDQRKCLFSAAKTAYGEDCNTKLAEVISSMGFPDTKSIPSNRFADVMAQIIEADNKGEEAPAVDESTGEILPDDTEDVLDVNQVSLDDL